MKRRQFITLFGSTAVAWPLAARAQQVRPLPRIGYLSVGFGGVGADAFREGLRDFGYVEGQNVLVEYRRAGEQGQLDALAAELVARKVEIIVCGGSQATRAALQQTKTIPIVTLSSNPVAVGFVASLANPGGNVTGVSLLGPEVAGKRLQLLKQLIPSVARVAVLWNPDDPTVHLSVEETQAAAATLALALQILETRNADAINAAMVSASNAGAEAVVLLPTPLFDGGAEQIAHQDADALFQQRSSKGRHSDVVWSRYCGEHPAPSVFRRSHPQGSKAGRSAGRGANKIRTGAQSQHGEDARPRHSASAARTRRRGDRVKRRGFIPLLGGAAAAWQRARRLGRAAHRRVPSASERID